MLKNMVPAQSPPPPPPRQPTVAALVHDARAVHDTASLLFHDFSINGRTQWVVAVLKPSFDSGSSIAVGLRPEDKEGRLVSAPEGSPAIKKAGSWREIVAAPQATHSNGGTYSWLEPIQSHKHILVPEDYYSPFVSGGTIVCRFVSSNTGSTQFEGVRLIFPDWAQNVASASAFVDSHPGLLEGGEKKAQEILQLRPLLADKNELLAVEAFRELATTGHLNADLALDCLNRAESPLDAIFAYLMLVNGGGNELSEKVDTAIRTSREVSKLQSIALGAFSALLFENRESKVMARSKAALQHVHSRILQLRTPIDSDSYLQLIFSKSGLQ